MTSPPSPCDDEAPFRLMAENLPTLCWMANPDGYIVWYNRGWHDYCGTTPAEMEGWGWQSVHDPAVLPEVLERWTTAIAAAEPFEMTFPIRGADGVYRPFLTRVRPYKDDAGGVLRWFGVNTDISAQVEAEAALRKNEALFRTLAQAMPNQVWAAAADGQLDWFNDRVHDYSGATRGTLDGEGWGRIVHPDDLPEATKRWTNAIASGAGYETEFRLRRGDGHYRWHIARAEPVRAADGRIVRWVGANTDIEDGKTAAQALARLNETLEEQVNQRTAVLQATESRLRSIFETGFQFQGFMSPDGVLLDANPSSLEAIRAQLSDVVGMPFWETPWFAETPGMTEQVRAAAATVAEGGSVRQEITVNLPGGVRSFDFSMRPVLDAAGAVIGIVPEAMETTERRQAEEALRQSQKMEAVGQLTGGIAHDFNNMLAVVSGSLELLGRRIDPSDTRARRYAEAAGDAARRAAALTQRLLAFSRQQPLRPERIQPNRLVAGMSDLLAHSLGGAVRLETVLAAGLWPTNADPNQLENAILNLAVNARDAMSEGGRLTIETQNAHVDERYAAANPGLIPGHYVMIAVSDTGSGMAPEVAAKAFDPFFTTKAVGKGTGLGLSQVYGFVKQSGGHAKIYSEPGQGTSIKIYLPRLRGAATQDEADEAVPPLVLGDRHELVLVVEDEPAVRQFSVDALSELGYRVVEADCAAGALRLLETQPDVALMFTDVVMPEINGSRLAGEARRLRPDLKVLFTTGYTRNAVVHNGVLDPGVEMIGKPFSVEELAAKVRSILDAP